jgi:hypothetical protein
VNDLELLELAGRALDPPDVPLTALDSRVLESIAERPHGTRRAWRRPAVAAGAVAGGAVAAGLAVALATVLALGGGPAGQDSGSAGHSGAPASQPSSPAAAVPPPSDPKLVLLGAARTLRAGATTPRPDQFVYVESVTARGTAGPDRTVIGQLKTTRTRAWYSVDGGQDSLFRSTGDPMGASLPEMAQPGCRNGRLVGSRPLPCTPLPAYRTDLPTDVDGMQRRLQAGPSLVAALYDLLPTTFISRLLSPDSQALVFEATTRLPGVTLDQNATDAAGRHGVAVVVSSSQSRVEFVFDPTGNTYLGCNIYDKTSTGYTLLLTALIRTAIVDRTGQLP